MTANRAHAALLPRLIRLRDAPFYLGMDRNRFNAEVRPFLTEIPIGEQGVAFDRLELDAWVRTISPATGVPVNRQETMYGTQKDARALPAAGHLAH
jgi:hypothetical protein